jgi:hypothetical protein
MTAAGSAVVGTASMVFFVLGGIAAATALQQIYRGDFRVSSSRAVHLTDR